MTFAMRPRITPLPRSFLYVPGTRPDLFDKAFAGPADALILDLEDAVPFLDKPAAREAITAWLASHSTADRMTETWVRVSAEFLADDFAAVVRPGLDGVVVAKSSPEVLTSAAAIMARLEVERSLDLVPVVGLVETAAALRDLTSPGRPDRVMTFGIGEVDLLGDLRIRRTARNAAVIDALRLQVVQACAAAGLSAPVAPTSTDFRDLDAFETGTRRLVDLGFRSRTAIHPSQVDIINAALTPSPAELAEADNLIARFDDAQGGVAVDATGSLIDAAVVREAREILSRR